jgi:archaellum component FlaC
MSSRMKERPLTIESIKEALLPSIAELFESSIERSDNKFKGIDKRFDGVDKKFDDIDRRFDGVDKRFEKVHQEIHGVKIIIEQMDRKIDTSLQVASMTTGQAIAINDHSQRIEKLEGEVIVIQKTIKTPSL